MNRKAPATPTTAISTLPRAEPATLDEVSRVLRISDGVMRHMATRRPKNAGKPMSAPPQAADEPVSVGADLEDE